MLEHTLLEVVKKLRYVRFRTFALYISGYLLNANDTQPTKFTRYVPVSRRCFLKARYGFKRYILAILICLAGLTFAGCVSFSSKSAAQATDYSQARHWLSIPVVVQAVDVFYLYPTAWQRKDKDPVICTIDNPSMLAGSASAFTRSASAFETVANIFAPYYRQADATYALALPFSEHEALIAGIPTQDAAAAFEYYINHFNNGRPFILAGHSQGSNVLINLLTGYLKDHPDVYKRMVAAYVIGYPVTAQIIADHPHLKFAEGEDDTGVIISYNTQAPDVNPADNPVLSGLVGLVINPITWTRTETLATAAEGLGSIMPDRATLKFSPVPQYADARVDIANGVLICSTANEDALYELTRHGISRGVYHSFEYLFYFFNIRENAQARVTSYLKNGT